MMLCMRFLRIAIAVISRQRLQTEEAGKTLLNLGESRLPSVQIKIVLRIKETAPASVLDKFAATGFGEKEVLSEK